MFKPISALVDPTLLLESDPDVIEPMSHFFNPTLPSESDFHEAVESVPLSINNTLPLEIEVFDSIILFTSSSKLTKQGGNEISSDQPPPTSQITSFDWDNLVEPRLPSNAPFQIKVKVEPYTIARCIVDEGALVSILSARAWQGMGSPSLVSTASQLLAFDRRTCIALGFLAQTPVTLGGKIVLVDFMLIEDPLDFNMLLIRDYVYAMQYVVSTLFRVMYFNHGK